MEILQRIYRDRAEFYNCDPALFSTPGILFIPEMKLSNALTLARVGSHLILRYDPQFDLPIHQLENLDHSSTKHVMRFLEDYMKGAGLSWNDPYIYHYKVDTCLPGNPAPVLDIQRFPESKLDELNAFFSACSDDDLEEADIILDKPDPVIFTGRIEGKIVAYVSHRYLSQGIANMGILVHSGYRKKGYGSAMVRHNTIWCIENGKIPLYIVNQKNLGSMALIKKLHYTPIIEAFRFD